MDPPANEVGAGASPPEAPPPAQLVGGTHVALRLWTHPQRTRDFVMHSRPYETVGYVLEGRARLHLGVQIVTLRAGDAYLVPPHAEHAYEIIEAPFRSLEAISPLPRPTEARTGCPPSRET